MRFRSLVMYVRTILIATRRPSYVPCETSAKPPHWTSTEPSEQSGTCMGVGITRCLLHVLQSLLSNFSRSRSDMVPLSRRCGSCQLWGGRDVKKLASFIWLTCLCISESELCKNWNREAIRGSIFPSCCRPISAFRMFQSLLDFLRFGHSNHLV